MRRRLPFLRTLATLSLGLALTTALALGFVRMDRVVVAQGRLVGGTRAVRAPLAGRVGELRIAEGAAVEIGQLLLVVEVEGLEAERAQAEARASGIEERTRALVASREHLLRSEHPAEVRRVALALEQARLRAAASERRVLSLERLRDDGLVTALELDEAQTERELAALAQQEEQLVQDGLEAAQRAQLDGIDAELRELASRGREGRAQLEELERQAAATRVLAPEGGVVLGVDGAPLAELLGRSVEAGQELCRLAVAPADRFEGRVHDQGRTHVQAGLPVQVRVEGYPWLIHGTLPGRVTFLSARRSAEGGFPVTAAVESGDGPGALYEGMGAEARIVIEGRVRLGRLLFERLVEPDEP